MWIFLISFVLYLSPIFSCDSSAVNAYYPEFRILGGLPVLQAHEFPYQVSIQRNNKHSCGGSIISPTKILTAGHCVFNHEKNEFTILVGIKCLNESINSEQNFKVLNYTIHPRFQKSNLDHDIAVITLENEIKFNKSTNSAGIRSKPVEAGEKLIVSGWGRTSRYSKGSQSLQWVQVTALHTSKCKRAMRNSSHILSRRKNVCTTPMLGLGTCKGDSGGPLVDLNDQLVGIVSWGKPCAKGHHPDVYTSVAYHYDWILEQL